MVSDISQWLENLGLGEWIELGIPMGLRKKLSVLGDEQFEARPIETRPSQAKQTGTAERRPWQRGSNENTNGLLRQYFPKGTDLSVLAGSSEQSGSAAERTAPQDIGVRAQI